MQFISRQFLIFNLSLMHAASLVLLRAITHFRRHILLALHYSVKLVTRSCLIAPTWIGYPRVILILNSTLQNRSCNRKSFGEKKTIFEKSNFTFYSTCTIFDNEISLLASFLRLCRCVKKLIVDVFVFYELFLASRSYR